MYKTYEDKVVCPKGHQFTIVRQKSKAGQIVRTNCPQCKKMYEIRAGKVRSTRI